MKTTNPRPERRTQTNTRGILCPPPSPARASRIHATTSLNAAAAMAVSPMRVVRSLSSAMMRMSTGNAMMERATPMKTRNCRNLALSAPSTILRRMTATLMPHMKGREIPTGTMQNAFRLLQRMEWRSSSRPTRKREKKKAYAGYRFKRGHAPWREYTVQITFVSSQRWWAQQNSTLLKVKINNLN